MDWRQSLAGVDEDYLVGISNKGIVKRAYKDLEAAGSEALAAAAGIHWDAQELTVAAGGETVTIRYPLGESQCSCPSRSICRHVVMAILLARQAADNKNEESCGDGNETEKGVPNNQSVRGAGDGGADNQSAGENGGCDGHNTGEVGRRDSADQSVQTAESEAPSDQNAAESGSAGSDGQGRISTERRGNEDTRKTKGSGSDKESFGGNGGNLGQQVWQEILAYPRKPLLRALGSKGLRRIVTAMEAENMPQVERGSVVRMQLPGQDVSVKLLAPLEYSTCACHKKELCSHKAEAILWCQYLEKQLTVRDLTGELEQEPDFDLPELKDTAGQVKDCLEHLLETGLARSGVEQAQELERLAILCHNAGLPGWEGEIRALAEGYEKYLRRAAGQTMEKLAGQLQRLYGKTVQLGMLVDKALSNTGNAALNGLEQNRNSNTADGDAVTAQTQDITPDRNIAPDQSRTSETMQRTKSAITQIQALAGEFRSEYLPVGDLELTGITVEHFVSDSGYEGDTVYFLEIATGTWYTYTNARPTFYEGKRRRGYQEKAPAPWGVPLTLEALASVRLLLRGAKCDAGGRLSSTQETKGEILGKSELTAAKLEGWYYRNYDRLFAEQIPEPGKKAPPGKDRSGYPRLVFVQAARFEQGHFNEITQKLELPVWDEEGRQVLVELPYSKRDEDSIRYLERLRKKQQPCFLGRVYLQGSRICLYPVDLLERQELVGAEESVSAEEDEDFWGGEFPGKGFEGENDWAKDAESDAEAERMENAGKDGEENMGKDAEDNTEEDIGENAEGDVEEGPEEDSGEAEDAARVACGAAPGMRGHNMGACQTLQSYLEEISWLLQEIYQVGSATVQDSTLEALQRAEKQGAGYGMATLADWLRQLREQLSQSRHCLRHQPSDIMKVFCRLWQYVQLCRQRSAYDMAGLIYQQ